MITYSEILLKGFVFEHIDIGKELEGLIWAQDFERSTAQSSVSYFIKQVDSLVTKKLIELACSKTDDSYLINLISNFSFDANKMIKGDFMELHNEISQKSPVEIIIWLPLDNIYSGRNFLMDCDGELKTFQPKKGSICFIDTTSLINRHGVSILESDTQVISLVGGLGRKND